MPTYTIEPTEGNVHGYFSSELPPILTIDAGDTVIFRTLDAGWGLEAQHPDGSPRRKLPQPSPEHSGHALCGPIAIRNAEPGMTLIVEINQIVPGDFGFTSSGWGWSPVLHERVGISAEENWLRWSLDKNTMTGRNQHGQTVALHPFMGVMGVAPAEAGIHPTAPPRPVGGNMDCKDLIAGSTLYLPIAVKEALFSVGDGHGAQGHGEVSGLAIECPMDRVELTFHLRDDMPIKNPCANTPKGWIAMGFDPDLDEAFWDALNGILDIMIREYSITRADALALASVVVDTHVTQMVNGTRGIHTLLPHGAIK